MGSVLKRLPHALENPSQLQQEIAHLLISQQFTQTEIDNILKDLNLLMARLTTQELTQAWLKAE